MKRRGFIAAILAAPLVFLGIFTGSHVSGKVKITEIWMRTTDTVNSTTYTTAPISPSKNRIVVALVCDRDGKGEVIRIMDYPGKNPPWVHIGTFSNCDGIKRVSVK